MLGSISEHAMDIETAEVVETFRADIHRVEREVVRVETSLIARIEHVETSLNAKIEHVETSLNAKIEHVETSLNAKIEHVEMSLNAKIEGVEASLNAKIERVETSLAGKMDEHKHHADIQRESMHDDIRMLAEHIVTLSSKVDSLRR